VLVSSVIASVLPYARRTHPRPLDLGCKWWHNLLVLRHSQPRCDDRTEPDLPVSLVSDITQNQSFFEKQSIPRHRGRSKSKAVSQKRHGRIFFLNGGDGFPRVKLPKTSCLFDNNLSPGVGGAPSQKQYLKNGMVENVLNGRDQFPRVKLPKISRLFDNNLSPSVGGSPSRKLYLKNGTVENFFNDGVGFLRVKLPKISPLFDNNLSPGVGGAIRQKPISQKRRGRKFFRRRSCIQHILMYQNQSLI
jgi:hypothetical protein